MIQILVQTKHWQIWEQNERENIGYKKVEEKLFDILEKEFERLPKVEKSNLMLEERMKNTSNN